VHLIDFIIRIYHDARPSECQIPQKHILKRVADNAALIVSADITRLAGEFRLSMR